MRDSGDYAVFGDTVATGLIDVASDPRALEAGGWWAVATTFEGAFRAFRFESTSAATRTDAVPTRPAIPAAAWTSSLDQDGYEAAVRTVRADIARGWVYQVNACRVLRADVPRDFDPLGAYRALVDGNPAPYAGLLHVPGGDHPATIISASPELLLRRRGQRIVSGPIKGTAVTEHDILPKDRDENVMIVDLVRNDLSAVAVAGTVEVEHLMRVEEHPGLVHLVSDIGCDIAPETTWKQVLDAVLPAGSVSGAPKSSALEVIARIEPVPRGYYCGAFGWIDADRDEATLAVAIRTFWVSDGQIRFGTGAGITWGSDPTGEWLETELKARRLLAVMAGEA